MKDGGNPDLPYSYLVIEGNIGAGKTTLTRLLSQQFRCDVVLEAFADNPFLPLFYADKDRYALMVELFFMSERHAQMEPLLRQPTLFGAPVLADYLFLKTWLFARSTLKDRERDLFRRLFDQLNATVPLPQKLVYLHRPVGVLLAHIAKRGRDYEQNITQEYLQQIEQTYWSYFREEKRYPVVAIDTGLLDFETDNTVFSHIQSIVQQPHPDGLTVVRL